jgi:hypothetical protein
MVEPWFAVCIPIQIAEAGPSVRPLGGVGATRLRLRWEEGQHACPFGRRVGDSADIWRRPPHHSRPRRAKLRPGALAVSAVCHSAVCRPDSRAARSSSDWRPSPVRAQSRGGKHWIQTRCLIHNRQPQRLQPTDPLTPHLRQFGHQTHTTGNRETRRHRPPDYRPWYEWIPWRLTDSSKPEPAFVNGKLHLFANKPRARSQKHPKPDTLVPRSFRFS